MCGIAGILKVHPPGTPPPPPEVAIPESWLDVLDESIKHRGPDGQGRFRDRATRPDGSVVDVAFVHRRLAIIDLADGQQPMVSERGPGYPERERSNRVAVVFNGCIYNHRELRRELENSGHEFVTDHSDTEVLIHGWREWGHELFAKLDGMFAATIWDASTATMVLGRDRFGEKPLYFDDQAGSVRFASSMAGLSRIRSACGYVRGISDDVSKFVLAGWIAFGWNSEPPQRSMKSVQPGYERFFGEWDRSELRLRERLAKWRWGSQRDTSIDPAEVDSLLSAAVHLRLEADVPIGIFLSGGIDSALVALYASKAAPDIEAFTVRMPIPEFDESQAAATTARALAIRHHVLECAPSPAEDLVTAIQQLGLPFGDSSLLPSLWVSRAARGAVRVALGGDGGDELFLGYQRQRVLPALAVSRRVPASIRNAGSRLCAPSLADPIRRRRQFARLIVALSEGSYDELLAIFPRSIFSDVICDDVDFLFKRASMWQQTKTGTTEEFIASALAKDLFEYLPEDLLRKTDTASMSVALEVRSPFLAKELVDRMIRVRPDVLMPDGERKGLLKSVARKYLPEEIVNRPKMGFSIPIGEWFRTDYGGMKQLLLDTLNSADPFPEDLLGIKINRVYVAKMIADHMDRKRDHSQRLYMLLVLAIWVNWLRAVSRGAA